MEFWIVFVALAAVGSAVGGFLTGGVSCSSDNP